MKGFVTNCADGLRKLVFGNVKVSPNITLSFLFLLASIRVAEGNSTPAFVVLLNVFNNAWVMSRLWYLVSLYVFHCPFFKFDIKGCNVSPVWEWQILSFWISIKLISLASSGGTISGQTTNDLTNCVQDFLQCRCWRWQQQLHLEWERTSFTNSVWRTPNGKYFKYLLLGLSIRCYDWNSKI